MSDTLYWSDLHLGQDIIPASSVAFGEHIRLVMDYSHQYACLQHMLAPGEYRDDSAWDMWLDAEDGRYLVGTPEFSSHIGSIIRQHGLIANLTLVENLLLPFMYRGNRLELEQAADEVESVGNVIGLGSSLHERAGERSAYTHALISLGRCLLSKPKIIVAQEAHIGMAPEHLEHFRELSLEALSLLGAGLLYLTESPNEGSGLNFASTLTIRSDSNSSLDTEV